MCFFANQKVNYVVDSKEYPLTDNKVIQDLLHDWELSKSKDVSFEYQGYTNKYTITFCKVDSKNPQLKTYRNPIPYILKDHGYPLCSCPAYTYNRKYHNCKHIERLLLKWDFQLMILIGVEFKNV